MPAASTAGAAVRVLIFPEWRENPYLNLLGLAPRADGMELRGADSFEGLVRALSQLRSGDILHIHWTTPILQFCRTSRAARRHVRRLSRSVRLAKARGVRVAWTVHNRLPHEMAYPGQEIALYRLLGQASDIVLTMAPATRQIVSDIVRLDRAKTKTMPHPSYEGIYESGVSRQAARASFGLAPDEQAVLFVGQIRPYKGVAALARAVEMAAPESRSTLMLGGVVKEMDDEEFEKSLPAGVRTILQLSFVEDADVARWFRAADVMVLPYRSVLNSGSLHLAGTFGVPVILPDLPHLVEQFGSQRWVAFFDRDDPERSIAALLSDEQLFDGLSAEDFEAFLRPIAPWDVSRHYLAVLRELSG